MSTSSNVGRCRGSSATQARPSATYEGGTVAADTIAGVGEEVGVEGGRAALHLTGRLLGCIVASLHHAQVLRRLEQYIQDMGLQGVCALQ